MQQQNTSTFLRDYVTPACKGALAGCVATIPMTATILSLQRRQPPRQRTSSPPKKITMSVLRRLGLKPHMSRPQQRKTAWAAHFAYGTTMGALYGPLARRVPLPSILKGGVFGLLVWAVSYLGWLPAMNLPEAATDEPPERNAQMVAAHLVWGGVLGSVLRALKG